VSRQEQGAAGTRFEWTPEHKATFPPPRKAFFAMVSWLLVASAIRTAAASPTTRKSQLSVKT
jgi:hypothetical protein